MGLVTWLNNFYVPSTTCFLSDELQVCTLLLLRHITTVLLILSFCLFCILVYIFIARRIRIVRYIPWPGRPLYVVHHAPVMCEKNGSTDHYVFSARRLNSLHLCHTVLWGNSGVPEIRALPSRVPNSERKTIFLLVRHGMTTAVSVQLSQGGISMPNVHNTCLWDRSV